MQVGFRCPDGAKILHEDCLKSCRQPIRVNGFNVRRCGTLSQLSTLARPRQWNGKPSVTQLIQPTRIAYLRITCGYYVCPDDMVFSLVGTKAHKRLDGADTKYSLLEQFLENEEYTGLSDNYEVEGDVAILNDYKTWGSFRCVRALGVVKVGYKDDPSGAVYKTSGYWGKAGTPKQVPIWGFNPDMAKLTDEEFQLNSYRILWEDTGFPVDVLMLRVFVRDGGLEVATDRGITQKFYSIPIKKLQNTIVTDYLTDKRQRLLGYLALGELPPVCADEENWNGRRCKDYCEVSEFCPDKKGSKYESTG